MESIGLYASVGVSLKPLYGSNITKDVELLHNGEHSLFIANRNDRTTVSWDTGISTRPVTETYYYDVSIFTIYLCISLCLYLFFT